jgi:hypothetical protein
LWSVTSFQVMLVQLLFCVLTGGEVVKIAQLASIAGPQSRVAQPETPVTLQFQGNKFTLSHSQLRQLTAGQPLQLQGKRQPAGTIAEKDRGTPFLALHLRTCLGSTKKRVGPCKVQGLPPGMRAH